MNKDIRDDEERRNGDRDDDERDEAPARQAAAPARAAGGSPFKLYKPGQGKYVRWCTAVGGAVIALTGAQFTYERLGAFGMAADSALRMVLPVIVLAGLAYAIWWFVGYARGPVEFMIATEGEMKKVNWSSRKEVTGATKVVIITVLVLSVLLFATDIASILFLSLIKVYKVDLLSQLFGGAAQ